MEKISKKYQKTNRPKKIVQFGEGNFLRAFVDWMVHHMNEKDLLNSNVALIQPLEFGRVKDLENSEGLYTVVLEGIEDGEVKTQTQVIDCLDDFINPYSEYDKFLTLARSKALKMVISNTTEAGIVLDETDTNFSKTPKSFPGKLLVFLLERYQYFNGAIDKGLHIVPCELIDHNGDILKKTLIDLAKINNLDADFLNWLENANTFSNTLVDRIVTGYPKNEIDYLQNKLGYNDPSLVKGEYFHLWVIEGPKELQEFFPADKAGLNVLYVDDIRPYKERKVKILNGSHTWMVPIGYLYGLKTVKETVENEDIYPVLQKFIFDEVLKTIDLDETEIKTFANQVIERFKNPSIVHQLLSISLNSTTKFKTRILKTIIDYIERYKSLPKTALFGLAALFVFFKERPVQVKDDKVLLDMWQRAWEGYDGTMESINLVVNEVLGNTSHWEYDLRTHKGVVDYLSEMINNICQLGMKEALKKI